MLTAMRWAEAALITLLVLTAGCEQKASTQQQPVVVATLTMRGRPLAITEEYPAQLEASNTVEFVLMVLVLLVKPSGLTGRAT